MQTIKELLNDAADILEEKGWIQGKLQSDEGLCARGAMYLAARGRPILELATAEVERELDIKPNLGSGLNVLKWNDHPDRTKFDVINTFRKVAENCD